MTTTQSMAAANLIAPSVDDDMQISNSPYLDTEDYEIQLEDEGHYLDEHDMLDDVTDQQNYTAEAVVNDDLMDESVHNDQIDAAEETYDLEVPDAVDEEQAADNEHYIELEEFDEEIQHDTLDHVEERSGEQDISNAEEYGLTEEHVDYEEELYEEEYEEEEEQQTTNVDNDKLHQSTAEHNPATVDDIEHEDNKDDVDVPTDQDEDKLKLQTAEEQDLIEYDEDDYLTSDLLDPKLPANGTEEQQKQSLTIETNIADHPSPTNSNHSPTPLHPILVQYGDEEFTLFAAPDAEDPDDALLQDPTLATLPFDKFLTICRETLGALGDDDELVLEVPSLGLTITEDSKHAAKTSVVQVIDLYMLLSQNEHLADIPPLSCRMYHRVCLETQLAYLVTSAREGKTYSEVTEEHIDTPYLEQADTFETFEDEDQAVEEGDHDQQESNDHVPEEVGVVHEEIDDVHEDGDYDAAQYAQAFNDDFEQATEPTQDNAEAVIETYEEGDTSEVESKNHNEVLEMSERKTEQSDAIIDPPTNKPGIPDSDDQPTIDLLEDDNTNAVNEPLPELDEDLFADEDFDGKPATVTDMADEDQLDFDAWDAETDAAIITTEPPVTPAKSINGKRKLEETEDDLLDFDFTPEPKRTKSS